MFRESSNGGGNLKLDTAYSTKEPMAKLVIEGRMVGKKPNESH
jgi:hypothetical protein